MEDKNHWSDWTS